MRLDAMAIEHAIILRQQKTTLPLRHPVTPDYG